LQAGTARRILLVRDGSEAIAKAVMHFWPDALQQEFLVHVERGLCGKLLRSCIFAKNRHTEKFPVVLSCELAQKARA